MTIEYYDRDGAPLEFLEWAQKLEDRSYAVIRQDFTKHMQVSTVWFGLDHSFGDGPPLIFETMTFWLQGVNLGPSLYQNRYSTEKEALKGHKEALKAAQEYERLIEKEAPHARSGASSTRPSRRDRWRFHRRLFRRSDV